METAAGSMGAGSGREVSTVGDIEVCMLCRSVDCRGSGGGRFGGWGVSAGVLLDAAATASSLLNGAIPSFGIGIVDGSGLVPPLVFIVCPVTAPLARLRPASVDLLFSMVPTNDNEIQVRPLLVKHVRSLLNHRCRTW